MVLSELGDWATEMSSSGKERQTPPWKGVAVWWGGHGLQKACSVLEIHRRLDQTQLRCVISQSPMLFSQPGDIQDLACLAQGHTESAGEHEHQYFTCTKCNIYQFKKKKHISTHFILTA